MIKKTTIRNNKENKYKFIDLCILKKLLRCILFISPKTLRDILKQCIARAKSS